MKKFLRSYITPFLGSISLIMLPAALTATETITSTGYALITSSINKDIFRTRAIENALQKIVLESGQDLNSFSIVENGKVLLDQIQTRSAIKVLQYDIIDETIKNKKYHVTVQAILGQDKSETVSNACKKARIQSADFSLELKINQNHFPAWFNLTDEWVLSELRKNSFKPTLNIAKKIKSKQNTDNLYNLFDRKAFSDKSNNIYGIHTDIIFTRESRHNPLEKTTILHTRIETTLKRNNEIIAETQFDQPYRIQQRVYNNLFTTAHRGHWGKIKQHFSNLLKDRINKQISSLDCVNITPRVFSKSGMPFIDFGRLDGIGESDMFVIKSNTAKKTYLKIIEVKDHETQVEIVSQQENIASINGKIVELVVGS